MTEIVMVYRIIYPMLVVMNLSFAILLLYLRNRSDKESLTLSQRWGLTILFWLYLTNSILLAVNITRTILGEPEGWIYWNAVRADSTLNNLTFLGLLLFGLVFPRPIMSWKRLKVLMVILTAVFIPIVMSSAINPTLVGPTPLTNSTVLKDFVYIAAISIPLFLWIPQYQKTSSPQLKMVMTLVIWGYFMDFMVVGIRVLIMSWMNHAFYITTIPRLCIVIILLILLIRILYQRWGNWRTPEYVNAFMIGLALGIGIIAGLTVEHFETASNANFIAASFRLSITALGWTIIRPIFFAYAILRYQSFGPKVKADQAMRIFITFVGTGFCMMLTFLALFTLSMVVAAVAMIIVGVLVFYPLYRFSRKLVDMALPMSHDSAIASLRERRNTYNMGLLTAVVNAEISEPHDVEVLEHLRDDLHINEREHQILMEGFRQQRVQRIRSMPEDVYLFYKDGTLLNHTSKYRSSMDPESDTLGAMITTITNFFNDAMRKGGDVVDSIEYGDKTMVVEVTRTMGLVVMLKGRDSPELRQRMRDLLWNIRTASGPEVEAALGGKSSDIERARAILGRSDSDFRRFLDGR